MHVKAVGGWGRRLRLSISKQLHTLLYYIIYFTYLFSEAFASALRSAKHFLNPPLAPPECMPPHVGLSGAIADHLSHVCEFISLLVPRGTVHVSLHDPSTALDTQILVQHLQTIQQDAIVREVGSFGERHVASVKATTGTVCESTDLIVTAIHPGADRDVLVRATKQLAAQNTPRTVSEVSDWLDTQAEGMLPSEPDVVVVFPPEGGPIVRSLQGFVIWQLRLTQIRFPNLPVTRMPIPMFLRTVADAASAPKRFGR